MSVHREEAIVIAQPVHQHAYETAVAAQEAGLLRYFFTGLYDTGRGLTSPRLQAFLPGGLREQVERDLRRRRHPQLEADRVVTISRYHALATAYRRTIGRRPLLRALQFDTWAHERFDATVGRALARSTPARIVHGFEGSTLATFRAARQTGALTALDAPSAREYAMRAEGRSASGPASQRVSEERELADYVFAPSDFVVACLLEHGVPAEKIVKIPYGVDPTRFAPSGAPRRDRRFRALFVGRIGLRKGVRYLLEAWRRLSLPDAELVLIGEPDRAGREILREYAGLYRWLGSMPNHEVHGWFRESDLFVFPSLSEGSAYVSYEAMASGLPMVTTPNCGAVLRDGVEGFLVPPRDVDALAEKILFLYERPDVRTEMGARARALIEARYSWRHYRGRIGAAYLAILSGAPVQTAVDLEVARCS